MSRRAGSLALAGVAALVGWLVLALVGARVMPSYLAAWLFWLAIPVGALPLVMGLEFAGAGSAPVTVVLRPLLLLTPLVAVFVIPILVQVRPLYPWSAAQQHGLAAVWFTTGFFIARAIFYLVVWTALSLLFARPSRGTSGRRGGIAGFGLMLHLVVGSLAAADWAMSLDLGLGSSCFGLLLIAAQCSLALAAALLLSPARGDPELLPQFASLTLVLLGIWVFLHFAQFLIVWSADLPKEIIWYQRRDSGLGAAAEWLGLAALALALILLLPRRLVSRPGLVAALAALILVTHLVEMLWLVTPNFRGAFSISLADVLALIGVGGVVLAALQAFHLRELGHDRA